ncbi:MAG TPA: YeeE/YedE family protein [Polyangiaceae bacterium]|jgi:hypothetical protein|nr:YeeE/YedE family protein [Polyangiaceae bacterium]
MSSLPWKELLGGALVGAAASILLAVNGRVMGISNITGGLLRPRPGDSAWRLWFLAGLLGAGLISRWIAPSAIYPSPAPSWLLVGAGFLVGLGTRVGNGCTSGHGVCGISRGSVRSVVATLLFVGAGMTTVTLLRLARGG